MNNIKCDVVNNVVREVFSALEGVNNVLLMPGEKTFKFDVLLKEGYSQIL